MSASTQLARQWGIFTALHNSNGITANELAKRFGVSKNTIVRDIDTLLAGGFAVRPRQEGNKYLYDVPTDIRKLADIKPTPLELLALYAARAQLLPLAGTPVFGDLMTLIHKIQGVVQSKGGAVLQSLASVFMEHPRGVKSYRDHENIIDDLVESILKNRVCIIEYKKPRRSKGKTHELRPLRLFFNQGGLYLIGLLGEHKYVSTLAVERIRTLDKTRKKFKVPRGLNLQKRYAPLFGVTEEEKSHSVEIVFSADAAPFIRERIWHPDQVLEEMKDGRLRWKAKVKGRYEIIRWVMSRADECELIKPKAWRKELAERLGDARGTYE